MIENKDQLIAVAAEANGLLQQIADYTKLHPGEAWHGRVRFPRGFIGTAQDKRRKLSFISDETLKRNVSYALMTHDVLRWLAYHTDLSGQAREMIIKEAVCLLGTICESITIFPEEYGLGRGSGQKKRIARLVELEVIDKKLQRRLNWLWDKRNQEHIYDLNFREFDHWVNGDWYRAVKAWRGLRDGLTVWRARKV
ncbi:MAG TPA: hypothetical protein VGD10_12650 [Allosphingosinicella sp.]|uniref:hypothetical protein n=1 Tax=Allosphingosinicella sp. TaxID=2823234 RepID=UPI002ED9D4CD